MKQETGSEAPRRGRLSTFLRAVFASHNRSFTLMVVPHSNKKSFHLTINIYAVLLVIAMAAVVLLAFLVLATEYTTSDMLYVQQREADQTAQDELERVIRDINRLRQSAQQFDSSIGSAMTRLGISPPADSRTQSVGGDLGNLFGLQEVQEGDFRQLYEIQYMRSSIEDSIEPMERIFEVVSDQQDLLEDIPHVWPIEGGRGVVVASFGPGFHPVFDTWHMQSGLKIAAAGYGDAVLAAANGTVAKIDFDPQYRGWYVRVEHRYGFSTQYSHLNNIFVSEGERLSQGQIIGEVGDTGYAMRPQLGFEIMIGSDALDPAAFIQTAETNARWTGSVRSGT